MNAITNYRHSKWIVVFINGAFWLIVLFDITNYSNWTILLERATVISGEATCIVKQFTNACQDDYFQCSGIICHGIGLELLYTLQRNSCFSNGNKSRNTPLGTCRIKWNQECVEIILWANQNKTFKFSHPIIWELQKDIWHNGRYTQKKWVNFIFAT